MAVKLRLQISSGNGPEECELAVRKFLDSIKKEFKNLEIVETSKGKYKDTYKYVVVESTDDSFYKGFHKSI